MSYQAAVIVKNFIKSSDLSGIELNLMNLYDFFFEKNIIQKKEAFLGAKGRTRGVVDLEIDYEELNNISSKSPYDNSNLLASPVRNLVFDNGFSFSLQEGVSVKDLEPFTSPLIVQAIKRWYAEKIINESSGKVKR